MVAAAAVGIGRRLMVIRRKKHVLLLLLWLGGGDHDGLADAGMMLRHSAAVGVQHRSVKRRRSSSSSMGLVV